jgi:hypothetical protein
MWGGGQFIWNVSSNIIRVMKKTTMNWGMQHAQTYEKSIQIGDYFGTLGLNENIILKMNSRERVGRTGCIHLAENRFHWNPHSSTATELLVPFKRGS